MKRVVFYTSAGSDTFDIRHTINGHSCGLFHSRRSVSVRNLEVPVADGPVVRDWLVLIDGRSLRGLFNRQTDTLLARPRIYELKFTPSAVDVEAYYVLESLKIF